MFTIKKQFSFSASHQLKGLPETHPCSQLHGHNFQVIVELKSDRVYGAGFVCDYRELQPIKEFIDECLDHRHLNDVVPFNPTSEHLAMFLFLKFEKQFPQISAVSIKETDKTMARFELNSNEPEYVRKAYRAYLNI